MNLNTISLAAVYQVYVNLRLLPFNECDCLSCALYTVCCVWQMNGSSAGDASGNVSLSAADNDADAGDTSLYAVVYGLGAVAIVVAICLRGIIFMTVRYITLSLLRRHHR